MATYPATNSKEASELLIDGSNQVHEVVNGDALTEVTTDSGTIPSLRKAISDTFLFQDPIPWSQGSDETAFNQLRTFDSNIYWAPSATLSTPIPMGVTPIGDNNWKLAPVDVSREWTLDEITTAQNDIVGGSIFKGSNGETVEVGDVVEAGITHLRILVDGKPAVVRMGSFADGIVSELTESSVTIGVTSITLHRFLNGGYQATDSELASIVPLVGEQWFNTTYNTIHMGDGITQGGIPHLSNATKQVVASGPTLNAIDTELIYPDRRSGAANKQVFDSFTKNISTDTLSARNPMQRVVESGFLYVVTQGSYDANEQGYLDIFDIRDNNKAKKVGSIAVGPVGALPRSLAIDGSYAYVRRFGGGLHVIDISDKQNPVELDYLILGSGNSEDCINLGNVLAYPKLTGDIDFISISDNENPRFIKEITINENLRNGVVEGNNLWVVGYVSVNSPNLFKIDISDKLNPVLSGSYQIDNLLFARFPTLSNGHIFVGGFGEGVSKLISIDIRDANNPTKVWESTTLNGRDPCATGRVLVSDSTVLDITDPTEPVVYKPIGFDMYKPIAKGGVIFGFGDEDGAVGSAPNDSLADAKVLSFDLTGYSIPSGVIAELTTDKINTREFTSENVKTSNLKALASSVEGESSAGSLLIKKGEVAFTGNISEVNSVKFGVLSSPTVIAKIKPLRSFTLTIEYTAVNNQSLASGSSIVHGKKVFMSHYFNEVINVIKAPTDVYAPVKGGPVDFDVTFTVVDDGSGDGVIEIKAESSGMGTGSPVLFYKITANSYIAGFGIKGAS